MIEHWKNVKGFEGLYLISNLGNVKSLSRKVSHGKSSITVSEKLLSKTPNEKGYLTVELWKNGKRLRRRIHALMLESFIGDRPLKHDACHNDGNRKNNKLSNLRWDTHLNNIRDKHSHGTSGRRGL